MSDELPEWIRPPVEGFKAGDLDRIKGLPEHVELIDGSLAFFPRQSAGHTSTIYMIARHFRDVAPPGYRVCSHTVVVCGPDQRLEPDVLVLKRNQVPPDATYVWARDVVLLVEVVEPATRTRDTKRKPQIYAEAGIPHLWIVEIERSGPVVRVYELDRALGRYEQVGDFRDVVTLTTPFEVTLDLSSYHNL